MAWDLNPFSHPPRTLTTPNRVTRLSFSLSLSRSRLPLSTIRNSVQNLHGTQQGLETMIANNEMDLLKYKVFKPPKDNLTTAERRALSEPPNCVMPSLTLSIGLLTLPPPTIRWKYVGWLCCYITFISLLQPQKPMSRHQQNVSMLFSSCDIGHSSFSGLSRQFSKMVTIVTQRYIWDGVNPLYQLLLSQRNAGKHDFVLPQKKIIF